MDQLPQQLAKEIQLSMEIQSIFSDLDDSNIEEAYDKVFNSKIIKTPDSIEHLFHHFYLFTSFRPHRISAFVELFHQLIAKASSTNCLYLLNKLINQSFLLNVIKQPIYHGKSITKMNIFYCFIKSGVISISLVLNLLENLYEKSASYFQHLHQLVVYILPEIAEHKPKLLKKINELYLSEFKDELCEDWASTFESYQANNWSLLKEIREYEYPRNSLYYAIKVDNVDMFQEISSDPQFQYDQTVPTSFFQITTLSHRPTLIQMAAVYGSIKCFKFLMLNGSKPELYSKPPYTLMQCAILGGNMEIIHILEQQKVDLSGSLHTAIQVHRNDIYHWLHDTYYTDINDLPNNLLEYCCHFNNIEILLELFEHEGTNDQLDPIKEFNRLKHPLHVAVKYRNVDIIRILLTRPWIDVNRAKKNTALAMACKRKAFSIVSVLLSDPRIYINSPIKDDLNSYPIHYLAYMGDVDLMRKILEKSDVNINVLNSDKVHAAEIAAKRNYPDIYDLITAHPKCDPRFPKGGFQIVRFAISFDKNRIFKPYFHKYFFIKMNDATKKIPYIPGRSIDSLYSSTNDRNFGILSYENVSISTRDSPDSQGILPGFILQSKRMKTFIVKRK